jgi:sigma-B regulation protein RsbU (phosphoserine phosphatase)
MEEIRDADLKEQILQRKEKMHKGTYGLCEGCHEPIEKGRLPVDPFIRNCIDHLTPTEQRVLEQDLDLAYEIQNVLLPKQNIKVGGWSTSYIYKPAGPVSGDYLDIVIPEEEDGSLVFLLGDVSGKGVAASMLMANLHAIFRSLIKVNIPIDKLVEKANRLFCEATMLTHFATLVCGVAQPSGEIEICNAGHCFPLLIKEERIERIEPTGFPLGMFCGGQYSTKKIKLAQGESLFLHSDGLSEARNGSKLLYGDERLTTLISKKYEATPQGLVEACLEDLKNFQSGFPISDDLTMMVIQRVN